jgi:hypothetical protein
MPNGGSTENIPGRGGSFTSIIKYATDVSGTPSIFTVQLKEKVRVVPIGRVFAAITKLTTDGLIVIDFLIFI